MATISDLSPELVIEILSRVPFTSLSAVRSTCKRWNDLSKEGIVCKAEAKEQYLGLMMGDAKVCSVRFDLQNEYPSIKQVDKLDGVIVSDVFHCDGLVLCLTNDNSKVVVWNPYLGQIRSIKTRNAIERRIRNYGFGYDSCRIPKILMFSKDEKSQILEFELYDFNSDSWRALDVTCDLQINGFQWRGVCLKGNTYWNVVDLDYRELHNDFLLCFDFTRERFGPSLEFPYQEQFEVTGSLYCVRDEKLAVLFQNCGSHKMEIWVTTKIEPELVSWTKFLAFDMNLFINGSFFIDVEKKLAVRFHSRVPQILVMDFRKFAYFIGENGCYMEVDLGESDIFSLPIVWSYVPSLVQIE